MKKGELILVWITAALICVLLGFFLGRNAGLGITIPGTVNNPTQSSDPTSDFIGKKVNINKATIDELKEIPGIGQQIANNIVTYRAIYGPFMTVDDLLNVDLISESKLEAIRDYISLSD